MFRDPRPFHPQRLAAAIERDLGPACHGRILRSRGFARIASRPGAVASWASVGPRLRLDRFGDDDGSAPAGAELVLFGEGLDRAGLVAALGACVLTAEELLAGPETWRALDDPLPTWL